ncbi:glutamyl-tRNA reductase [Paenibacillus yonginensis]|uniref:Glutamyl-tRNA reductase n=1 Tax=Paenibacillus yonginensis TaxID=1462996 RepID=A0A1B1N253_9BACL|nr:glutamyl-tRNA reductase [Paenibacillus yonginensis]ANS75517.1 glutamyl-tRNA reductase [Paenibacillus yonginensis]
MHVMAVGLNYRTAPVEVREKFTFADADLPKALAELKQIKGVLEAVLLATCNRTEFYVVVDRLPMCAHYIRSFMEQWFGVQRTEFTQHLYIYEEDQAIEHLFRVAAGLDSMVLGETQILGQVKSAFLLAQQEKATGTFFNMLFKQVITLGKRAHSETSIGESAVSVSYAAVELGKRIFGSFSGKKVLILGAGKMSELTVKHLYANGADEVIVANRTLERAEELASKFEGTPCTLEQAASRLGDVDIVISSTGSDSYVLKSPQVAAVMKRRPSRPLFMIDIAVPRDLDPQISNVSNVFLYDIDDLEGIVESNLEMRRSEATKIEVMIAQEMDAFALWLQTLGVRPVIRALQQKATTIHEDTLQSLFNKLPELDEHQRTVIRRLTRSIVNQMMSDPINRIKEMAAEKNGGDALDMFSQIFALEDQLQEDGRKPSEAREAGEERSGRSSSAPGKVTYPVAQMSV